MIRQIDRILVRVRGLPAAVRYYRETLGLKLIREESKLAVFQFAQADTQLVIHDDPDLPAEATYLLVDDVRDLHRRNAELKLTFVSPPTRVARGYRATVRDPFGAVLMLIDRSGAGDSTEDGRTPGALFAGVAIKAPVRHEKLVEIYLKIARTADDLPYTPQFESLYEQYIDDFPEPKPDRAEVWRHLLTTRKSGKLPKLGEAKSRPPEVLPEARDRLRTLLGKDIGKRDRLPYTVRFDEISAQFTRGMRRTMSPHQLWRLIATLAK